MAYTKNCCNFDPSHVFANLSPRVLADKNDDNFSEKQKRKVEVSGSAEMMIPPDECILTVVFVSKKEKASDARTSVARRSDYVRQTLLNHGVQKNDMEVTESLTRLDDRGLYCMETQIDATFHNDLQKCMQLSSIFVEKLDNSVKVLPPVLKHNPQKMEIIRKRTCLMALTNARQKAIEVCRLLGQQLGRPVFVTENVVREWKGDGGRGGEDDDAPPVPALPCVGGGETKQRDAIDVRRRLAEMSITVRVDVTATFELKSKTGGKKKAA